MKSKLCQCLNKITQFVNRFKSDVISDVIIGYIDPFYAYSANLVTNYVCFALPIEVSNSVLIFIE